MEVFFGVLVIVIIVFTYIKHFVDKDWREAHEQQLNAHDNNMAMERLRREREESIALIEAGMIPDHLRNRVTRADENVHDIDVPPPHPLCRACGSRRVYVNGRDTCGRGQFDICDVVGEKLS